MNNFREYLQAFRSQLARRYETPETGMFIEGIQKWSKSAYGQHVLGLERCNLKRLIGETSGHTALMISPFEDFNFSDICSYTQRINSVMASDNTMGAGSLLQDAAFLPFEENSLNLIVMHHSLEFSPNPQQILKEAARVTKHQGHIIIVGFNPYSLAGLLKWPKQTFGVQGISRRQNLRAGRLNDWLQFLEFSCLKTNYLAHNFPLNQLAYLRHTAKIDEKLAGSFLPFGTCYCLLARKDESGFTPFKPEWSMRAIKQALVLPQTVASAQSNRREATIIPFRTNIKSRV